MPCQLMLPCEEERHAAAVADELAKVVVGPVRSVMSLPALHPLQTANVMARRLIPGRRVDVIGPFAPAGTLPRLEALVRKLAAAEENTLLVLTRPELSILIERLTRVGLNSVRATSEAPGSIPPGTVISLLASAEGCVIVFRLDGALQAP